MPEDFVIARNPDSASTLPYLIRLPLPGRPVVLKARETWPRTSKVYCHRAEEWPAEPDLVERVPVRSCVQRGAAVDLVLDRGRENRSQLVFTRVLAGARRSSGSPHARASRPGPASVRPLPGRLGCPPSPSWSTGTSATPTALRPSRSTWSLGRSSPVTTPSSTTAK